MSNEADVSYESNGDIEREHKECGIGLRMPNSPHPHGNVGKHGHAESAYSDGYAIGERNE